MYYDKQIRYIDYLENGEKQRNCGYVKMTVTENRLLLEMQIKGLYETDDVASEVALEGAGAERRIGTILIRQGSGSFQWEIKDTVHAGEQLAIGEGLSYGQLEHIHVQLSPRRSLRCVWREVVTRPELTEQVREDAVQTYGADEAELVKSTVAQGFEKSDIAQSVGMDSIKLEQVSTTQVTGSIVISQEDGEKVGESDGSDLTVIKSASELEQKVGEPQRYDLMASVSKTEAIEKINEPGEGVTESTTGGNTEEINPIGGAEIDNSVMPEEDFAESTMENLTGDGVQSETKSGSRSGAETETQNMVQDKTHGDAKNVMEIAEFHRDVGSGVNAKNRTASEDHQVQMPLRDHPVQVTLESRKAPRPPHMTSMSEDKWQQLQKIYPHIRPFQDEREYLSLRPEDFVILHSSGYQLVQNSFLLHGYYNYDHLILTQVSQRNGNQFYIGVPGNFYEKEKQVAIMYGFGSFECKQEPAQEGDFGYYMIKVEL